MSQISEERKWIAVRPRDTINPSVWGVKPRPKDSSVGNQPRIAPPQLLQWSKVKLLEKMCCVAWVVFGLLNFSEIIYIQYYRLDFLFPYVYTLMTFIPKLIIVVVIFIFALAWLNYTKWFKNMRDLVYYSTERHDPHKKLKNIMTLPIINSIGVPILANEMLIEHRRFDSNYKNFLKYNHKLKIWSVMHMILTIIGVVFVVQNWFDMSIIWTVNFAEVLIFTSFLGIIFTIYTTKIMQSQLKDFTTPLFRLTSN